MSEQNFEFEPYQKLSRLKRTVVVTEKIDGTNAQILINKEAGVFKVGSRSRWLTLGDDNFGFCSWACRNKDALIEELGDGRHFGEWWGQGIQRKYGQDERHFSLFNTGRWNGAEEGKRLKLCRTVPVLFIGSWDDFNIENIMLKLKTGGSVAAPGFMDPEGVVVFHSASNQSFKVTYEHDKLGKEASRAAEALTALASCP